MAYEIEKAILYYMIEGFDSNRLNEDLFSYIDNKLIFKEIRKIRRRGGPLDFVILAEAINQTHPEITTSYLSDLDSGVIKGGFQEVYFKDYVNQLARLQKERQIKSVIAEVSKEPDFIPILKEILKDYEIEETQNIKEFSLTARTGAFRSYIEAKQSSELWGHKVESFPLLSKTLMGIREIIILSAKAKTGKSTLALQIATDLYLQGIPAIYFDFENGAVNLMARILSRKNSLSFEEIFSGEESRQAIIESGILKLKEYENFSIITDRRLTLERLQSYIKQAKRTSGRSDIFIVIDSLQKLPMENLKERRAAVDFWLRGFEEIKAEDPGLSILLISELSRKDGKPKESGDIEYTAHFLLELQMNRTEEELEKKGDDGIRNLFIRSARDIKIPAGPLKFETDFRYWTFTEMEKFG